MEPPPLHIVLLKKFYQAMAVFTRNTIQLLCTIILCDITFNLFMLHSFDVTTVLFLKVPKMDEKMLTKRSQLDGSKQLDTFVAYLEGICIILL